MAIQQNLMQTANNKKFQEWFEDYSCGAIEETQKDISTYIQSKGLLGENIKGEIAAIYELFEMSPKLENLQSELNANEGVFSAFSLYLKFYNKEDFKFAAAYIKKAVEFLPNNIFLREKAAEVHFRTKDYTFALECYAKLIQFSPSSVKYQEDYFKSLYLEKRYQDLIQDFMKTKNKSKAVIRNAEILYLVGFSYLKLNKFTEAVTILEAIRGKENNLPSFEKIKEKIPSPQFIIKKIKDKKANKNKSKLLYELGVSYLFEGKYDSALQIFEGLKKGDESSLKISNKLERKAG